MKSLINLLLTVIAIGVSASAQVRDLGVINAKNWLAWDAVAGATSYNVYAADTNRTKSIPLGSVATNRWPGTNASSGLNGPYVITLTTVSASMFTNVSGTNITVSTNIVESAPSEAVLVTFRDGVPIPPTNIQLYTVLQFAATNALPTLSPDPSALSGR